MRKYLIAYLFGFVSIVAFSQQDSPLKFGFELDGKLKKVDPNTSYLSPTGAAYVGAFAEFKIANHFSSKLRVGMNNTYYHENERTTSEFETLPGISTVKQTLGVSLEPRYYFFPTEEKRRVNIYAALPALFETAPAWNEKNFSEVRSELTIIPSLGCRYDFTRHWGIEASIGLGWGKYFTKNNNPIKKQEMTYGLSVGVRYEF